MGLKPDHLCGVGRVVQFALCQSEAEMEEQNEVRAQAGYMRRQEEESRARELQRAQDENNQIQKDNARAQADYNKAMSEYQKKIAERCNYSQCNSGYEKYVST